MRYAPCVYFLSLVAGIQVCLHLRQSQSAIVAMSCVLLFETKMILDILITPSQENYSEYQALFAMICWLALNVFFQRVYVETSFYCALSWFLLAPIAVLESADIILKVINKQF